MKRILVFGSSGLVGSAICESLKGVELYKPTQKEVDLRQKTKVKKAIDDFRPDYVVHAVGFAGVESSEIEQKRALELNSLSVRNLASVLEDSKIPFLYISTDAVFDGSKKSSGHREIDHPIPKSFYGISKLKGEKYTLSSSKKNLVVRITLPYTVNFNKKSDFVRTALSSLSKSRPYDGINDQYINPLFLKDAAYAIKKLIFKRMSGIYHVAAANSITNFEFLTLLAKLEGVDQRLVNSIKLSDFQKNKKAYRSRNCVLEVLKYRKKVGNLPSVEQSLKNFIKELKKASK